MRVVLPHSDAACRIIMNKTNDDMTWHDTIQYDTIYEIWYDMIDIYDIWYDIWFDMTWHHMIYDIWWYDDIWYDMIRYDMIWYGTIWYDMIWYVIYDMIYLLTATGLTPRGSNIVHIYTNNTYNNAINNFSWKAFWDSNPEWSK